MYNKKKQLYLADIICCGLLLNQPFVNKKIEENNIWFAGLSFCVIEKD